MGNKNTNLQIAKRAKDDEFYTTYETIDLEISHYAKQFYDKVVLCNCDDPFESNFCKFFLRNFNKLHLKRLICTSYKSSKVVSTQFKLYDENNELLSNDYGYVLDVSSIGNGEFELSDDYISNFLQTSQVANKLKIKKMIALCVATIVFVLAIVGVCNVVNRSKILRPKGISSNIFINRKQNLLIGNGNANTIVFCEDNKPMVVCNLPDGFVATEQSQGLYADANGNFIEFNANYAENVVNPLADTDYYSYYVDKGYLSYMDMVRFAMYVDLKNIGVFSSNENIYLAGGARILRSQVCASQNADYYEIDGGLTKNGDKMRIYGFALHFDETTWLVTLKDCNDVYYFITVKAPDGVGKTIDTIGEFLSNIFVAE